MGGGLYNEQRCRQFSAWVARAWRGHGTGLARAPCTLSNTSFMFPTTRHPFKENWGQPTPVLTNMAESAGIFFRERGFRTPPPRSCAASGCRNCGLRRSLAAVALLSARPLSAEGASAAEARAGGFPGQIPARKSAPRAARQPHAARGPGARTGRMGRDVGPAFQRRYRDTPSSNLGVRLAETGVAQLSNDCPGTPLTSFLASGWRERDSSMPHLSTA
eukprot:gene25234-biopygen17991